MRLEKYTTYRVQEEQPSMFKGFFWGLVAGAAIGLLYAPKRGEETRTQLQQQFSSLQQQAQTRVNDLKEKSTPIINQARQTVNTTLNRTQSSANAALDQAQASVNGTAE
jgi:gas vesicle protein